MTLEGRTALVTGGARRLGAAIVRGLAENGCRTIIHCRRSILDAENLAAEIETEGGSCMVASRDLADPEGVGSWFDSLNEEVGGIDILINSASEYRRDRYETMEFSDLSRSMAIHAASPLAMIMAMRRRGTVGTVVNILDTRTDDRDPAHASYHLGKRALAALTRELAVDLAPNLRINAVSPGIVLPPEEQDSEWSERMRRTNPMGALGSTQDVVDAVLYLITAGFVTGEVLHVDGGRHLKGLTNEFQQS